MWVYIYTAWPGWGLRCIHTYLYKYIHIHMYTYILRGLSGV